MVGFGSNGKNEQNIYDIFIDKPGHYGVGNVTATGILKEVNMDQGYLVVQPSIVGYGEMGMRIETDNPTVISLGHGVPISMRPLREGDLENMLEDRKKLIKDKEEKEE
jgi:hypothetical protein